MKTRKINAKERLLGASILCLAVYAQQIPTAISGMDLDGSGFLAGTHDASGAPIPPATHSATDADDIIKNELKEQDLRGLLLTGVRTLAVRTPVAPGTVDPFVSLEDNLRNSKPGEEAKALRKSAEHFTDQNDLNNLLGIFNPLVDHSLDTATQFTRADISPEAKKPCQENLFKAIQGKKVESVDKAALKAALIKRPVGESLEIMMPAQQKQAIANLTEITKLIAAITDEERAKQIVANRLLRHRGIDLDVLDDPTVYETRKSHIERLHADIRTQEEKVNRLTNDIRYIGGIRTQAAETVRNLPETNEDNDPLLGQTFADNIATINADGVPRGAKTLQQLFQEDAWQKGDTTAMKDALEKLTNQQVYGAVTNGNNGGLLEHWTRDKATAHQSAHRACGTLAQALGIDAAHVPAANTVDDNWEPTDTPDDLQKRFLIQLAQDGANFFATLDAQRTQLDAKKDALKAVQESIKNAFGAVDAYKNTPELNVDEGNYNACKGAIIAQHTAFQNLERYLESDSPFLVEPVVLPTADQVRQQFTNAINVVGNAHNAFENRATDELNNWGQQLTDAQRDLNDLERQKRDTHVNSAHIGSHVSRAAWNTFEKLEALLGDKLESFVKSGALTGNDEEKTERLLNQYKAFAYQTAQDKSNAKFAKEELDIEF